jgi:hypothetical protein
MRRRTALVIASLLFSTLLSSAADKSGTPPVLSIALSDLPSNGGSRFLAMDLSPDEQSVAIAFQTFKAATSTERAIPGPLWIGHWNIPSKKLQNCRSISDSDWESNVTLRWTVDSKKIILNKGAELITLNSNSLEVVYRLDSGADVSAIKRRFRDLDLSNDGRFLVTLTDSGTRGLGRQSTITMYEVESGKPIASWTTAREIKTISVSNDGRKLLLSGGVVTDADVGIFDALTGRQEVGFDTGFEEWGSNGDSRWIDDEHFVSVPGYGTDSHGNFAGKSIRITRVSDGAVAIMTPDNFGPGGYLAVARLAPVTATINRPENWFCRIRRECRGSHAAGIIMLRYDTDQIQTTVQPLLDMAPEYKHPLHISAHAKYLALFQGNVAQVFEIGQWPKAERKRRADHTTWSKRPGADRIP